MTDSQSSILTDTLIATWRSQGRDGFLLSDPDAPDIEVRNVADPISGVSFRFRWLPHREMRTDIAELERRGILNPDRDETKLFRDSRDRSGRFCFLCEENIRECNPMEDLIPMSLAGRRYLAGANFAWISRNHYTVMAAEHIDQDFTPHVLEAMIELHTRTEGLFRVLYNGAHAGATIPWHLHYQITTDEFPVELLPAGEEASYPTAVRRVIAATGTGAEAYEVAAEWIELDPEHHRVNLLIAGPVGEATGYIFARDTRKSHAKEKGLMGGFEACGDLVYSEPDKRHLFLHASAELARRVLEEIRPDGT
ncbi:MAG: DUF4922 domain-containing protein [Actinomycetota bacterium]|nr:DUF4922 domain-containing protein [Actinomycetota bacterium]